MPFDIYDQAVLTALVNEPVDTALESAPALGQTIAPLRQIQSRMAKMEVGRTYALGIGQYKAPNAMPALVEMPLPERQEAIIELVQLEEMHRINSEQWIRLNSSDENIRNYEGLEVVDRGQILRRRLERLTEQQRWEVFVNGTLQITYPRTNSQLFVDYGFLPGHRPNAAVPWDDPTSSDPVADLEAWQLLVAEDSGFLATQIHMTSPDAKLMLQAESLKAYYNVPDGQPFRPSLQNVADLLAEGTQFVIHDAGWRPMAPIMAGDASPGRDEAAHTRFLPVGKVLLTTQYVVDGDPIADTLNGQVEISTAFNDTTISQGPQSEVILDHLTKNRYLREAAARITRLLHPECFLSATVQQV